MLTGGSRPYPIDPVRRARCMAVLEAMAMNITELGRKTGIARESVSRVISGRMISPAYEARIAEVLGVPQERLFPPRRRSDIERLRRLEESQRAKKRERLMARLAAETGGAS